jgi:hypothetical protein
MNDKPEEQPEENPNVGKQFEEIMGKNFTPEESKKMEVNAKYGELFGDESDNANEIASETNAISRMHDFPAHMIHYDDTYGYHVKMTTPRGWTHIWAGGPYIEHQSRPGNTEDVTNMEDYSKNHDEQPYYKGISMATFLGHVNDFEKDAEDNFPNDHKPPKP